MQLSKILENPQLKSIIKKVVNQNVTVDIQGVYYDSRQCQADSLFVAITGEQTDGNRFISNAIQNGAKAIVCENMDTPEQIADDIVYIVVVSARLALAYIAHAYYQHPASKLTIIGITGTNGKTTTAVLVRDILEQAGKKVGFIGTTGIYYDNIEQVATHTTPESLELAETLAVMLKTDVEYVVMEVSSHALVQQRVAGINFKIAAFTNLTHEHLDYHKTLEDYAAAKRLLFNGLTKESVAIVNSDDKYANYMIQQCLGECKTVVTGSNNSVAFSSADYTLQHIDIQRDNTHFSVETPTEAFNITTQLTAYFNVQNAALSFAICHTLGVAPQDIIAGLAESKGAKGRLETVIINSGAIAYVDYAHTPDALEKVLTQLRLLLRNNVNVCGDIGRLICVFGCGGDRDKTKRALMGKIASQHADIVCVTDDNPRTESSQAIIDDILQGIATNATTSEVVVIPNRSQAIAYAVGISRKEDIIVVAGKGHENYQIIGTEKIYFNDIEELKKYTN